MVMVAQALQPFSDEWYAACRKIYGRKEGLFIVAHRRWASDMMPAEVMGFMWEALLIAVKTYDRERKAPFVYWWLRKTRAVLQHYHRYQGQATIVRVPEKDFIAGARVQQTPVEYGTKEHEDFVHASR